MIFANIKGIHLDGHKNMSLSSRIEEQLDPEFVYFPLEGGGMKYTKLVEVGQKVLMGQPILMREGRFGHPICSSVSGEVVGVKRMWHSSGKMMEMYEIQNDHQDTPAYSKPNIEITRESIIEIMKNAGLVGLGGAGFPTYVKYLPTDDAKVVIINAAECEPYITGDYMSIMTNSTKLIEGLRLMMTASGAPEGVIAIKKSKKEAILVLREEIAKLGYTNIRVHLLKDVYPAGWEKYIVEKVLKKTYRTLPREAGAVINNVQTAIALYEAVNYGKPLIDRVVTITGEGIKEPKNLRLKIGSKFSWILPFCSGYVDGLDDAYFISGGPMTGRSILFDDLVITANVGSIIVMPKPAETLKPACMGCGKCAENCPAHLTPTSIKRAYAAKDVQELAALNTISCVQCGLCSYVCPSRVDMTDFVGKAKDMLIKANAVNKK